MRNYISLFYLCSSVPGSIELAEVHLWQKCICFLFFGFLCFTTGCDRDSAAISSAAPWPPQFSAVIHGRVIFDGIAPAPRILAPAGICGSGSPPIMDESTVAGTNSGLKNVLVFLTDPPATNCIQPTPAVLDQIGCKFAPHVIAVQAGQTLRLKSSDVMMHNVHLKCQVNPDQNYGFSAPGFHDISLLRPESPFIVKCDVHPWMTAYVAVLEHPWFAVSGDDGSFTIEHVPPGSFTLSAWQEALPTQTQKITVGQSGTTEVNFRFESP